MVRFRPLFLSAVIAILSAPSVLLAELSLEPKFVDFGKQKQEQTLSAIVTLSNAGDKTLQILRVGADCNCTAAQPEKMQLAPGESTQLRVTFETRSYHGEVSRTVLIQTSEGDVSIPVRAVVSQFENWIQGANLAVFRPSMKGESAESFFNIQYTGKADIEIKDVVADAPWLKARIVESKDGTYRIALTKEANAPAGNHQPKVTLHSTDPTEPNVSFTAFVSVQSRLAVSPNPILMPVTKVGQKTVMSVSLQGWEAKENPHGEIEGGAAKTVDRDGVDVLMEVSVTPESVGVGTRFLRLFAGESVEAEIPVIVRGEE